MIESSQDHETLDNELGEPSTGHIERKARIGRLIKILLSAIGVTVIVAGATFWYLYRTATAAVPEYEAMLVVAEEPELVEQERQRFESQVTTLISESQTEANWQMKISATEINAWLATRVSNELSDLDKNGFSDPRVMISADAMTFAVRSRVGSTQGVLSIKFVPFATEGGELGLQLITAKIGQLPMPIGRVVGLIEHITTDKNLPLRILQEEGTPIIILNLAGLRSDAPVLPKLVGFDLREGEILIRGESEALPEVATPPLVTN